MLRILTVKSTGLLILVDLLIGDYILLILLGRIILFIKFIVIL